MICTINHRADMRLSSASVSQAAQNTGCAAQQVSFACNPLDGTGTPAALWYIQLQDTLYAASPVCSIRDDLATNLFKGKGPMHRTAYMSRLFRHLTSFSLQRLERYGIELVRVCTVRLKSQISDRFVLNLLSITSAARHNTVKTKTPFWRMLYLLV